MLVGVFVIATAIAIAQLQNSNRRKFLLTFLLSVVPEMVGPAHFDVFDRSRDNQTADRKMLTSS